MTIDKNENEKVIDPLFFSNLAHIECSIRNTTAIPFTTIAALIDSFRENFGMSSLSENALLEPHLVQIYTRVASVLTNWLAFCDHSFDQYTLYYLSYRNDDFQKLFSVSGYRGFSHLINYMADEGVDGIVKIEGTRLAYLLAVLPLDELTDELFFAAQKLEEWQKSIVILGWLQSRIVLRASGEKYRGLLLDDLDFLKRVTPNYQMLRSFLNAWMHCTYAVSEKKHKIKKVLNEMIKNFLTSENITPPCKLHQLKNKPRMLIIHERFTRGHAMFRCYASLIHSLRQYFELISIGETEKVTEFPELFDRNFQLDKTDELKPIVELIVGLEPDVIYYPSLGMSHWTICLANLRLAPVQIVSAGHPATTQSDMIDYMFACDMPISLYKTLSERLLIVKKLSPTVVPHDQLFNVSFSDIKWSNNDFHIAVNAMSMKVNGDFIELCKRVVKKSQQNIVFHFFPALGGIEFDSFAYRLGIELPMARVYPTDNYVNFMHNLQKCHISISPFPFGNANGVIDALMCNLPIVALEGKDIAGLTDKITLAQCSLDDEFVCLTVEEYEHRIFLLANDKQYYESKVALIKDKSIKELVFSMIGNGGEIISNDFSHKFSYLFRFSYDYHNQIQSSKSKAIVFEEVGHAGLYREN